MQQRNDSNRKVKLLPFGSTTTICCQQRRRSSFAVVILLLLIGVAFHHDISCCVPVQSSSSLVSSCQPNEEMTIKNVDTMRTDSTSNTTTIEEEQHSSSMFPFLQPRKESAVICTLIKDADAYLDEWIDYHYAIGFSMFYIYVNEDYFYYNKRFSKKKNMDYVKLIHYPGQAKQMEILHDCAEQLIEYNTNNNNNTTNSNNNHTWAAFTDIDEFIVLNHHTHIVDMLQEYCPTGSLSLNWILMGQNDSDEYVPMPITKRCQYRQNVTHQLVKPIWKISDLDIFEGITNPHYVPLKRGTYNHDTNGREFHNGNNINGPIDIAALYHYQYKSRKEYVQKRERGVSNKNWNDPINDHLLKIAKDGFYSDIPFNIHDDRVWKFLKTNVPMKYSFFDNDAWD